MSKSNPSSHGSIYLLDAPESIREKIMMAETDPENTVYFDSESRPGLANLLNIYSILTTQFTEEIETLYAKKEPEQFKLDLAEVIIETLHPIQERYKEIIARKHSFTLVNGLVGAYNNNEKQREGFHEQGEICICFR